MSLGATSSKRISASGAETLRRCAQTEIPGRTQLQHQRTRWTAGRRLAETFLAHQVSHMIHRHQAAQYEQRQVHDYADGDRLVRHAG